MDGTKALQQLQAAYKTRDAQALVVAYMVASGAQAYSQEGFGQAVREFKAADETVVSLQAAVQALVQTGGPVE